MPGKCFPLSIAQQIFALKGSVCLASGCGEAGPALGGGHEVLRWAQAQTRHTHGHTRGHLRSSGGCGSQGASVDTDLWGPHSSPRGTEGTKPQRGCGHRWAERVLEPGSEPRAAAAQREAWHLPGQCCAHSPGLPGPACRVHLPPRVALCSAHPQASAHGRLSAVRPALLT